VLVSNGTPSVREDTSLRRLVDVVIATTALVLVVPLLALIAVIIRLDTPGPVIYRQERLGTNGRPFWLLKFRSMIAEADQCGAQVSSAHDPRVTRVGCYLRRTKLDELPQILNVLRGEMTLIGPRAEVACYADHYRQLERSLLRVRPGLTGPGQVWFSTDLANELDDVASPEQEYVNRQLHRKAEVDLAYLRHRTLATDLAVLWRTVGVVGRGLFGTRERQRSPARPDA
jgi:lipopolysaccharide/colanic/teichoic acid biosynthesis glycosyltransferase